MDFYTAIIIVFMFMSIIMFTGCMCLFLSCYHKPKPGYAGVVKKMGRIDVVFSGVVAFPVIHQYSEVSLEAHSINVKDRNFIVQIPKEKEAVICAQSRLVDKTREERIEFLRDILSNAIKKELDVNEELKKIGYEVISAS